MRSWAAAAQVSSATAANKARVGSWAASEMASIGDPAGSTGPRPLDHARVPLWQVKGVRARMVMAENFLDRSIQKSLAKELAVT
jgi:hypothetical protein